MANREIAKNVLEFLDLASSDFGRVQANKFSQDMYYKMLESGVESPIEDMFLVACAVQCAAASVDICPEPFIGRSGEAIFGFGITIQPQAVIGRYRVDFLISQSGIGPESVLSPVIVELDGHAFHDKDKRQRAYEKGRDRDLVKRGYKVLHFTGSEVVAYPYKVAFEALSMVGAFVNDREEYDPANPLGID